MNSSHEGSSRCQPDMKINSFSGEFPATEELLNMSSEFSYIDWLAHEQSREERVAGTHDRVTAA